ncbi:MAG: hypothetical protein K0R98_482 [Rickettsiaceae bacterium]|jgi:hypothetical protein|nr:hypothetical protein [Rickettsiaceae bacterium]
MSTVENVINQYKEDIDALHQIVSHTIKRLKAEVTSGTAPQGQKSLLEKHDVMYLSEKLNNMLGKIFAIEIKLASAKDKGSLSQITGRMQLLSKQIAKAGA